MTNAELTPNNNINNLNRDKQIESQSRDFRVAQQKIWAHWLLWLCPILNLPGPFISAYLIRAWKPLLIALSIACGGGFIVGITTPSYEDFSRRESLVIVTSLAANITGAVLTHSEIDKARIKSSVHREAD